MVTGRLAALREPVPLGSSRRHTGVHEVSLPGQGCRGVCVDSRRASRRAQEAQI